MAHANAPAPPAPASHEPIYAPLDVPHWMMRDVGFAPLTAVTLPLPVAVVVPTFVTAPTATVGAVTGTSVVKEDSAE